ILPEGGVWEAWEPEQSAGVGTPCGGRVGGYRAPSLHNHSGVVGEASAGPRLEEMVIATSYRLQRGLQVVVRQGDITKERADALVNAANEDLDHAGGVAAALSRAGGPEVQQASRDLVRQIGRVPTGTVVETTGGKLPCKMLLHAVGPVGGSVGENEHPLLEKTVKAALNLAETLKFQTLAMPCISSGIFGQPPYLSFFFSPSVGVPGDLMCTTGPGALGCKEIVHVSFNCDTQRISKVCGKILKQCERKGYRSAAFPAVNTGIVNTNTVAVFLRCWFVLETSLFQIERVQNVFLWQANTLCEQRIRAKNGAAEVGVKKLYHGTAATTCDAIESNGFDRSYYNAIHAITLGVYFAVNASYSANPRYTPPDASGHRRMYVARVLTGRYTLGDPTMRFTPRRSPTDSADRYDSLVDNLQRPSMFVIFHDDQAYPEYLITFI
uniref:Poly [ADP-ribose] polymerase n=1 Tax=Salmo trutta TaxID=8032 RepID=A0A674A5L2_SALTR